MSAEDGAGVPSDGPRPSVSRWSAIASGAEVVRPESVEALASELARARAAGRKVLPAGHGSRLSACGIEREADIVLTTEGLGRVLEYEPADLTITVEAGCTLAQLDRVLAERGQVLPLQTGRARGTVGGLVATAAQGATALAYGGVRDSLIGVRAALADGTVVKGGGHVVKNVAGYGLHRLMAGSHGTLGVIVEASFKVRPRPEARGTVLFTFEEDGGPIVTAPDVLQSGLEPIFVDILQDPGRSRLAVGFEGMADRVAVHLESVTASVAHRGLRGRRVLSRDEDDLLRRTLDDWSDPGARLPEGPRDPDIGERLVAMMSRWPERPVRALLRVDGRPSGIHALATLAQLGAWKGGPSTVIRDMRPGVGTAFLTIDAGDVETAVTAVRSALENARTAGSAVLLAAPRPVAASVDAWGPPPPDFFLMTKIKQALDPDGVLASGGFVGGL